MSDYVSFFIPASEVKSKLMEARKKHCDNRGYHRVSIEPKEKDVSSICLDCELSFDPHDKNSNYLVASSKSSQ